MYHLQIESRLDVIVPNWRNINKEPINTNNLTLETREEILRLQAAMSKLERETELPLRDDDEKVNVESWKSKIMLPIHQGMMFGDMIIKVVVPFLQKMPTLVRYFQVMNAFGDALDELFTEKFTKMLAAHLHLGSNLLCDQCDSLELMKTVIRHFRRRKVEDQEAHRAMIAGLVGQCRGKSYFALPR